MPRDRLDVARLLIKYSPGADPEISERGGGGGGSQILERGGGWNSTFQCGFQSFSYKSLTNIPPKEEPRPIRPLP